VIYLKKKQEHRYNSHFACCQEGVCALRKEIVILFCAFIIAILIGCESAYQTKAQRTYTIANANYDMSLISVERYTGTQKIFGRQSIEAVIEEGISKFYFEDEMVRIKWLPRPDDIVLVVHNKAFGPLKIVWDEARFVDEKGINHRLIHSGIGYEKRNDSQPSTIVAGKDTIEDFVHPVDYFQWEEGKGKKSSKQQGYWKRDAFVPTEIKGTAEELRVKAEPFVGKTFQVILALQIDDVRNDYACTFKINKVDVTEKEQQPEKKNPMKGKVMEKAAEGVHSDRLSGFDYVKNITIIVE
jgi:hypothetical protein